jgi:histidine ammonia-lyase
VVSFSFGTGILFPAERAWTPGRYAEEGVLAYSAAALLAQLKHLAMPVTLGSPPLDGDIEDHATLAPLAVTTTREALGTLETILTIEVLLAVDKLTSLRERRLGGKMETFYGAIRGALEADRGESALDRLVETVRRLLRQHAG